MGSKHSFSCLCAEIHSNPKIWQIPKKKHPIVHISDKSPESQHFLESKYVKPVLNSPTAQKLKNTR